MMLTPVSHNNLQFVSLANCKKEKFEIVRRIFNEVMTPAYGELAEIVRDIEKRDTRKTEILTCDGKDVGVIVYKRELTKTFRDQDLDNTFEVTFVALFNKEDENKGYRSKLFERIQDIAKKERATTIACRLPESLKDHVEYFKHKGYDIIKLPATGKVTEVVAAKILEQKRRKIEEVQSNQPKKVEQQRNQPQPQTREVTLKEPYLSAIINGTKTIEGRINSGQFRHYKVGDQVTFFNNQRRVTCEITKIEKFDGFKEMLAATDFKKCIPEANSVDAAFRAYEAIPGFIQRAKDNGVLAFHVQVKK